MIKFSSLFLLLVLWLYTPTANAETHTLAKQGQSLSWGNILDRLGGKRPPVRKRPGGGRGDLCAIAPGSIDETVKLWNTRPLFVWQGSYPTIGVRLANTASVLWRGVSEQGTPWQQLRYSGNPLPVGQTYEWLFFFDQTSKEPLFRVPFQVMTAKERAPITADLATLEAKLKSEKADQEEIALQRANYFAQRNLWADVLQEVYSVKNPSAELQQVAQAIETSVCQSDK